jgi:hypothetical protein
MAFYSHCMRTARYVASTALFCLACGTGAQEVEAPADAALVGRLLREPATPGVDPLARRAAIAQALAEPPPPRDAGPALSARSPEMERFDALVDEATVPDCLHADGLKRQPPRILFVQLRGPIALPFVLLAKLRGKCQ